MAEGLAMSETRASAERELAAWAEQHRKRDTLVRAAVGAGVSKHRIRQLTGIARTTIDRIVGGR
jgi:hypothetical protein